MADRLKFWNRWPMVVWLTGVWVLLWGELSVANVVVGAFLAIGLLTVFPMPKIGFEGRPWVPGMAALAVRFTGDVAMASVQVARRALGRRVPRGAVIRVRLRSHSDLLLTITSQLCSLVPGSIIVEAHRLTGTLYIHVFDVDDAGGIDAARAHALAIERRVMYALASDAEIEDAGLPARKRLLRRRARKEAPR